MTGDQGVGVDNRGVGDVKLVVVVVVVVEGVAIVGLQCPLRE